MTQAITLQEHSLKTSALAQIQNLINQSENRKKQLVKDYAKAIFKSSEAAYIFADMIVETAKISAYKYCTDLLLGK